MIQLERSCKGTRRQPHHGTMTRRHVSHQALWRAHLTAITLMGFCWGTALSQTMVTPGINSPTYSLTDRNGISLTSNRPSAQINDVSIGSKERPLHHWMATDDGDGATPTFRLGDSFWGKAQPAVAFDLSPKCPLPASYLDVSLGSSAERMCSTSGGAYTAFRGTGSTMITNPDGSLTYTQSDGTKRDYALQVNPSYRLITRVTDPNGMITVFSYKSAVVSTTTIYRLQSVIRNDGLMLKYTYASNAAPSTPADGPWRQIASVTAINIAIDYCDPVADACTYSQPWPVATYGRVNSGSLTYLTVTDAGGRSTRFTTGIPTLSGGTYLNPVNYTTKQLLAIRAPTSTSADTVTLTWCAVSGEYYCMHQGIKRLNINGYDWTYSGTSGGGGPSLYVALTAARPVGGNQITNQQRGNPAAGSLISYSDGISLRTFHFEATQSNRLSKVTLGDGNALSYAYDARGNITAETHTPSAGSPLSATSRTANFDTTCTNTLKCNKPNWVRDAKGNQTDYVYSTTHGGLLKVTSPPDSSGIRPQVRYGYTQRFAWYKNASGAVVQSGAGIWLLTSEKYCRKTQALSGGGCTGANDEVTVSYDYGPTSGANNLFLRGKSVTADGATLRTCYGNDIHGNRISETAPKAGVTSCP